MNLMTLVLQKFILLLFVNRGGLVKSVRKQREENKRKKSLHNPIDYGKKVTSTPRVLALFEMLTENPVMRIMCEA